MAEFFSRNLRIHMAYGITTLQCIKVHFSLKAVSLKIIKDGLHVKKKSVVPIKNLFDFPC